MKDVPLKGGAVNAMVVKKPDGAPFKGVTIKCHGKLSREEDKGTILSLLAALLLAAGYYEYFDVDCILGGASSFAW